MALKRPLPKNYAMYDAKGKARYKKDLAEYHKAKRAAEAKKNTLSTKKNIDKQKAANKKAVNKKAATTTKTTKGTTTTKPKSTAAKGKSLATGKTTSKTKAVETPKTTTATKTRTRTRTQTKSKTTPKKPVAKKPVAKKPVAKKPVAKKPVAKQPAKRGRPVGSKNKPKGNQNLKIAKETAGKTGKFLKEQGKKALDTGKKQYGKLKTKLSAKDQTPQQANPEPKTKGQKLMSRLNKSYQAYKGEVKTKAGETFAKSKDKLTDKSLKGQRRTGARAALAMEGGRRLTDALFNRLGKPKNMTVKEYDAAKKKMKSERNLVKDSLKIAKRIRNKFKGKSGESSTTKNINKQKTSNNNKLKVSNVSQRDKDLREAKRRVRKAKGYNKEKLQREVRYLEKFGKQGRTWSNPEGAKGNNKPSSVKVDKTSSGRKMHAIEKRNRERFGDAHVDRLKAKHAEWKKRRKKK